MKATGAGYFHTECPNIAGTNTEITCHHLSLFNLWPQAGSLHNLVSSTSQEEKKNQMSDLI